MNIKNYPQSIEEVETKILSSVLPSNLTEMRRHFFLIFEEESRERGAPYMVRTRGIREDWQINKSASPVLSGEEEAVSLSSLADLLRSGSSGGPTFKESSKESLKGTFKEDFPLQEIRIEEDSLPSLEPETVPEEGTPEIDWDAIPDEVEVVVPVRKVVRRVVRKNVRVATPERKEAAPPTKTKSFPSNFPSPTEEAKPGYSGTLRDFVKNNPNCTIEQASEYFPLREIKRHISQGRIFSRRGRLSI